VFYCLLTQNSSFIIGPVSKLLGLIMEGIFWVQNFVINLFGKEGVWYPNIGLSIIIFTIIIYLLLLPLTIKQQKFSKFSAIMNPEIKKIQDKYKGKTDNESMTKMQQETSAVYAKYGVSPTGSCLQLLIQMPILFALYRVIYAIPAYVKEVKSAFFPLVNNLIVQDGSNTFVSELQAAAYFRKQFKGDVFQTEAFAKVQDTVSTALASSVNPTITDTDVITVQNAFIDVLNRCSTKEWASIADKFSTLGPDIASTIERLDKYNVFLGLNMGYSPSNLILNELGVDHIFKQFGSINWSGANWWIIIGAVMIPLLAAFTQWLNVKLSPQANTNTEPGKEENPMMQSMKMMNVTMPLMSAVFCLTLPSGMGLYWIAGAVVRTIQQVIINKYIDKMDIDAVIAKNVEKYNKKIEKGGTLTQNIAKLANTNTANINNSSNTKPSSNLSKEEREAQIKKATEYLNKTNNKKSGTGGSLASKANLVKDYNERNNK